jgi:hypothetical protein
MNSTQPPSKGPRFLSQAERFKLWNHVQYNFAKANESDTVFAAAATVELGFPISHSSVGDARRGLGIPPNRPCPTGGGVDLLARMVECERLVKAVYVALGMETHLPERMKP